MASTAQGTRLTDEGEQYVQSLLFARYPNNSSPDHNGTSAVSTSSKKAPSPYKQGRPIPSGFGTRGSDFSLSSPERVGSTSAVPRSRAKAPPRKSVLDERNGIFGSSISNFSALNSPSRPAENSFLLSPVGHVSNEPRSGHHVAWEGEDIDGDIYLGSSSKMDISGQVTSASAYKATTPAENRGIAGTMNHSPGLFGINGTCGEEDSVNMYGDARNPLSMNEAAWQRWVVVFGFAGEANVVEKVLHEFQQFGDIESYVVSQGNCLFIRYASPLDARSAEHHNGNFLGASKCMIGVIRLSSGESSHKYRMMLQDARDVDRCNTRSDTTSRSCTSSSLGRPDRAISRIETGVVCDGALRHRREDLGSAVYRQHFKVNSTAEDDQIIMRVAPRRKKNICSQIYDFFFLY